MNIPNPLEVGLKHDVRFHDEQRAARLRKNPWEKFGVGVLSARDTFKFTPKGEHHIVVKIVGNVIEYRASLGDRVQKIDLATTTIKSVLIFKKEF